MSGVQIILTTLISVLTVLGGVFTALQARKANKESTVVTGYDSLVQHLQEESIAHNKEIKLQSDRIILLERRIEMFLRWGRAVIRWYESIEYLSDTSRLPTPYPILELNGEGK